MCVCVRERERESEREEERDMETERWWVLGGCRRDKGMGVTIGGVIRGL